MRHRKLDAPYRLTPLPCGGPARLDPSLELNQGDPPCSSPPWPLGGMQGWAACVSQHFSTFYEPSVQAMDTQLAHQHSVLARTVSGCLNSAFLNISQHFTSHLFRPWIRSSTAVNTSRPRSDRFWLLNGFSTFLNILRAICSGHGYAAQRTVNTSRLARTFLLLELRVSRTFLDFLRPRLFRPWIPSSARHRRRTPANVERGAWSEMAAGRDLIRESAEGPMTLKFQRFDDVSLMAA